MILSHAETTSLWIQNKILLKRRSSILYLSSPKTFTNLYSTLRNRMCLMNSYDVIWTLMMSYEILWSLTRSPMASYKLLWHHIMSCHNYAILWYDQLMWCRMNYYDVLWLYGLPHNLLWTIEHCMNSLQSLSGPRYKMPLLVPRYASMLGLGVKHFAEGVANSLTSSIDWVYILGIVLPRIYIAWLPSWWTWNTNHGGDLVRLEDIG